MLLHILKDKKVRGILQLVFSLVLLAVLVHQAGIDLIIDTILSIDVTWYLVAFLLFQLNMVIRAYRWMILLHALDKRPSFWQLIYLYYLGFFANNFIPSGFGGDVLKVVNLRQHYGRGTNALSSVVMDRLTGLLGTSLIALVALVWNGVSHTTNISLPTVLWIVIILISVGIPAGFLLVRYVKVLEIANRYIPTVQKIPLYDKIEQLIGTVRLYPMNILFKSLLISLPFTINLILIQYCIAKALAVDLPLAVFSLFAPVIAIINLLPFSFNGLGTRDAIYLLLFGFVNVAKASAIAMSLAYYFLRFSAGLIGGLLYLVKNILRFIKVPSPKQM